MATEEIKDEPQFSSPHTRLIHAFLEADPGKAEPLRLQHCITCRTSADKSTNAGLRAIICDQARCGLRNADKFRDEQQWVVVTLHELRSPELASDEALFRFNGHIHRAGSVTPALARTGTEPPELGALATSLRGELHAALIAYFTHLSGHVHMSLANLSPEAVTTLGGDVRGSRQLWQKRRAEALRAAGISDKKIAERLSVDPKTIREWLGNRTSK
jgi:hypothetical protein